MASSVAFGVWFYGNEGRSLMKSLRQKKESIGVFQQKMRSNELAGAAFPDMNNFK
jgi:hypothetical protein